MTAGKTLIHVGGAKTGTTAIQTALAQNRKQLRSNRVLYPGAELHHSTNLFPIRQVNGFETIVKEGVEAWDGFCQEIKSWQGNVVISSEVLLAIPENVINEIIDGFGRSHVEILITARSPYELVISQWQESIKAGDTISLAQFSDEVSRGPNNPTPQSLRFWIVAGYVHAIERWARKVGVKNVYVQCVDVTNGENTLRTFEKIAGIPHSLLGDGEQNQVNRSLTYSECELIRTCNEILLNGESSNHLYSTVAQDVILQILANKPNAHDPKIELPESFYASISPFVNSQVDEILSSGVNILGDSSLLSRKPSTSGDSRLSDVMVNLETLKILLNRYLKK